MNALKTIAEGLRGIACAAAAFSESARRATVSMRNLHRAILLNIRREYVTAGKPYGNGYAPMMRWFRETYSR